MTTDFSGLKYLNLRANNLAKVEEIEKLKSFTGLRKLVLSFNPFIEDNREAYIYIILSKLPELASLQHINKHEVTRSMREKTIQYVGNLWTVKKMKEKEERERQLALERANQLKNNDD